jgi:tetratricopeptide (TPR) repeat protein
MTGSRTVCTYIRIIVGALLVAGASGAALISPAGAQSSEQIRNWCFEDATEDQTIQGCTAVIKANRETPQDLANSYFNRGSAYAGKFQYERAIQDYDQAIKLVAGFSRAFQHRGLAYAKKRQFARAIQDYDQAIKLKPDSFGAFENRCAARMALKQLEAALADCNEALRLKPGSALQSRGLVNLKLERFDVAIGDFNEALKLEPKNAVALFGRGVARRKKGDVAGGDADIAAARAANVGVADRLAAIGITTK